VRCAAAVAAERGCRGADVVVLLLRSGAGWCKDEARP